MLVDDVTHDHIPNLPLSIIKLIIILMLHGGVVVYLKGRWWSYYTHTCQAFTLHFNHFYCTEICDKLRKDLAMFTYIYISMWMSVD